MFQKSAKYCVYLIFYVLILYSYTAVSVPSSVDNQQIWWDICVYFIIM